MARLVIIALIAASASSPAWGQATSTSRTEPPRGFALPGPTIPTQKPGRMFAGSEIAPGATLGLGMFGLKRDKGYLAPATAQELHQRKSRRAGVGLSLNF